MEKQAVVLVKAKSIEDSENLPPKESPEFLEDSIHWVEESCDSKPGSRGRNRRKVICFLTLSGLLLSAGMAWIALTVYFRAVTEPWTVVRSVSEQTGLSTNNSFDVYLLGADQITLHPEFSLLYGGIFTNLTLSSQKIRSLDGSPLYCDWHRQEFHNQEDRKLFSDKHNKTEPLTEVVISHNQGLVVRRKSLKTLGTRKPLATINYHVRLSKSPEGPFEAVIFMRTFVMFEEEDIVPFAQDRMKLAEN